MVMIIKLSLPIITTTVLGVFVSVACVLSCYIGSHYSKGTPLKINDLNPGIRFCIKNRKLLLGNKASYIVEGRDSEGYTETFYLECPDDTENLSVDNNFEIIPDGNLFFLSKAPES